MILTLLGRSCLSQQLLRRKRLFKLHEDDDRLHHHLVVDELDR